MTRALTLRRKSYLCVLQAGGRDPRVSGDNSSESQSTPFPCPRASKRAKLETEYKVVIGLWVQHVSLDARDLQL